MLCVVPLLRALRAKYPYAYIALMASPFNYEVILNNRYVSKIINYDKWQILGKGINGWMNLLRFIRTLRAERFEIAIVPSTVSTSFTSDLFAYLSGAPVRIGIESLDGMENPSSFFFNVPVELDWSSDPHRHQTLRNLDVASKLGLEAQDLTIEMTFDSHESDSYNDLKQHKLDLKKLVIAYHPGAGKFPNRWEAGRFAKVANTLSNELNASTVITCGLMDDEPVFEMVKWLTVPCNLIKGKPIREVAILLSSVDLVITNDTGVMHVAGAAGVSVLSLFGPTDPEQWAPVGAHNRYIRGKDGDINSITVDEVLKNAREMLVERIGNPLHNSWP